MDNLVIGKIPETILKRSVFGQIHHRRTEVLTEAGIGKDCAILGLQKEELLVLSTDPITGAAEQMGKLAVHITANDLACAGAEPIGILVTILLPEKSKEKTLRELMRELEETCAEINIEIMGGHSEVTDAVKKPIISVTGVGKVLKKEWEAVKKVLPGQDIILTKWAGLEGTAILAMDRKEELRERFPDGFLEEAIHLEDSISILKEAKIAFKHGAAAMHDVTEGGIFGALWELGETFGVGLSVDLKKIPIRQETIEICEYFDLNPYLLISSGCLLIATERGNELVKKLTENGIPAAVIGNICSGKDRVVLCKTEKRFLEPPKSDELYKVK